MILQALNQYYDRLKDEPDSGIAEPGFAPQKISFALVLSADGKLIHVKDIRVLSGKKAQPVEMMLPYAGKRTSGIVPNFLWDNSKYVLGIDDSGKPETKGTFQAFRDFHNELFRLCGKTDEFSAVINFLNNWDPSHFSKIPGNDEIIGKNLVFLIDRSNIFVHHCRPLTDFWIKRQQEQDKNAFHGLCLVTGQNDVLEEVHFPIKGIYDPGGQAEKAIISFNKDSFCSYAKKQSINAPVCSKAMFAYTTALNHLLRYASRQKIHIADATTVFWTERKSPLENLWADLIDPPDSAEADNKEVFDYLSAVREGKKPPRIDTSIRMYVLGLSPNSSRIAVRFWMADTIDEFDRHLGSHFQSIHIVKQYPGDKEFPGMWRLLIETLPAKKELRKTENVNPLLAGALMRAVLTGGRYPESLLATLITRLRSDGDVSYCRAALIKAVLVRNYHKEVSMGLDESSVHVAYRLGRLFAVMEKAQEEAIPGANATIKDRYYGSASATPAVVFPQLLRMAQHHLSKIGGGSRVVKEKLMQSIMDAIATFPRHLALEEQGLFALGYYHQRNAFFQKKDTADGNASENMKGEQA